jgi:hypothetical protein
MSMIQQLQRPQTPLTFRKVLWRLFHKPAIVLIGGTWKVGKTDFSLYIAERLVKAGLVTEVASNIDTSGTYQYITDLLTLKQWLYSNNRLKLFILDEANEHLPNTGSMTKKSVGTKSIIPQISKAHGRMIIVGHNLMKIDATMLDETWCRGIFFKRSLKNATVISNLLERDFNVVDIPPTKVPFDPYVLAPFTERSTGKFWFKDKDMQLIQRWAYGETCKDLGMHKMELHRMLISYVKNSLENQIHDSQQYSVGVTPVQNVTEE